MFRTRRFLLLAATALAALPTLAHATGIDTANTSTSLPFSVGGQQMMDLTTTGLAVGVPTPIRNMTVGYESSMITYPWGMAYFNVSDGSGSNGGSLDIRGLGSNGTAEVSLNILELNANTVGIGTPNPPQKLSLYSGGNDYMDINAPIANQSAISFSDTSNGADWVLYRYQGTRDLSLWNPTTGDILHANQSNGNIGIGNSTPKTPLDVNGEVVGRLAGAGLSQFRMYATPYSSMWRNDGSNTYLLMTAANDLYGIWNGLRPFYVNNASGMVNMTNGAYVDGGLTVNNTPNAQAGSPAATVTVGGGVQLGGDGTCNASKAGTISFTNGNFQGCNGSSWISLSPGTPANKSATVNQTFQDCTGNHPLVCTATTDGYGNVYIESNRQKSTISPQLSKVFTYGILSSCGGVYYWIGFTCVADHDGLTISAHSWDAGGAGSTTFAYTPWQ